LPGLVRNSVQEISGGREAVVERGSNGIQRTFRGIQTALNGQKSCALRGGQELMNGMAGGSGLARRDGSEKSPGDAVAGLCHFPLASDNAKRKRLAGSEIPRGAGVEARLVGYVEGF
jgi:hypothetical protein